MPPRRPWTEEEKQRIAETTRTAMQRPEVQAKLHKPRPQGAISKRGSLNPMYGKHPSEETTARRKASMRGRHVGEDNPAFKGKKAGLGAIHRWLTRRHPLVGVCSRCGKNGRTERAFLRWPQPYTRNPRDYAEMCRACHTKHDHASGERVGYR